MKKLKFIGFLMALAVMVTSLTSCLSNSNNDSSTQSGAELLYYETYGTFKSLDGTRLYTATNATTSLQMGSLYYVYYTLNPTNSTESTTKATAKTRFSITIQQTSDGTLGAYRIGGGYSDSQAIELATFKEDTTQLDTLNNEASFISLNGNSSDSAFYIWNNYGRYTLLTGMNYYFNIPNANSKTALQDVLNTNKYFLYYDKSKLTEQAGTLNLYLKRYTTSANPKTNQVLVSYGYGTTFQHPQLYYKTFGLDEAIAAYKEANGSAPKNITVTANINSSDWKVLNGNSKSYTVAFSEN